uniref:Uncharacterized protein n=1 Tax=Anopheles farauti TaxID=69004 RepID=A0A182Q693_9DIPT
MRSTRTRSSWTGRQDPGSVPDRCRNEPDPGACGTTVASEDGPSVEPGVDPSLEPDSPEGTSVEEPSSEPDSPEGASVVTGDELAASVTLTIFIHINLRLSGGRQWHERVTLVVSTVATECPLRTVLHLVVHGRGSSITIIDTELKSDIVQTQVVFAAAVGSSGLWSHARHQQPL